MADLARRDLVQRGALIAGGLATARLLAACAGSDATTTSAWTNDLYARTKPYRSGFAYQDYMDPELDDWQHAYYGSNLARLRRTKSKYDPDGFFRFAQSIPPTGGSDA